MTEHLTDEDRRELRFLVHNRSGFDIQQAHDAVEAIVTRHMAAPEALADEWERQAADPSDPVYKIGLFSAAGELRAAIHADPSPAPFVWVDKATGERCPTRGKTLCTIQDPAHRHVAEHMWTASSPA
jgi:hypothetical protein